jgi:hypothetical protein
VDSGLKIQNHNNEGNNNTKHPTHKTNKEFDALFWREFKQDVSAVYKILKDAESA